MSRKAMIILNSIVIWATLGASPVTASITLEYGNVDWSGTVCPGHAMNLQQAGEQGYDMVIAMGGDGTVHEVVNGLMLLPENKRPLLGIVPVGSGNDFAFANNIPKIRSCPCTRAPR